MMPEHTGTGAGRHHDRQTRAIQDLQLGTGHGFGLIPVSRSPGRLPATALLLREMHADAFTFQQTNGVQPGFREEQIHHAGAKQGDGLGLFRVIPLRLPLRGYTGGIGGGIVKQVAHWLVPQYTLKLTNL